MEIPIPGLIFLMLVAMMGGGAVGFSLMLRLHHEILSELARPVVPPIRTFECPVCGLPRDVDDDIGEDSWGHQACDEADWG